MNFLKKIKKLERKHMHELTVMCGSVALLLMLAVFVSSGMPAKVYAWIIYVYPVSYTPVTVGGYTTISWTAPTSDVCSIVGPTLPCISGRGLGTRAGGGAPYCYTTVNGAYGNVYTGPINGPTTYTISCTNFSGGWGSSDAYGSNSITVYPTPPPTPSTFISFAPASASIAPGGNTNLVWNYAPGNNFYGCEIYGGNWPGGIYWLTYAGSVNTGALNTNATYNVNCYDSTNGWGAWHPTTVTVLPAPVPVTADATSNSPRTVGQSATISFHADASTLPTRCGIWNYNGSTLLSEVATCPTSANASYTTPVYTSPGTYAYQFWYKDSNGTWVLGKTVNVVVTVPACANGLNSTYQPSCTCPVGQRQSGSTCVVAPLCGNGLNDSYAPSCACPSGQYQPLGASTCVALPICANGLGPAYSPSCTCPASQVQVRGGTTCVLQGSIVSFTANPSRVLAEHSASVSWSTSHMNACTLSAFDSTQTRSLSTALSSAITPVVHNKTIFTLTCSDASGASYSSSVTVGLIPKVIEK